MIVVDKRKGEMRALYASEMKLKQMKALNSMLSYRIAKELTIKSSYPARLAKRLKEHEQKIYYHIRKLEKAGIVEVAKRRNVHGAMANYYRTATPAFVLALKDFESDQQVAGMQKEPVEFLEPFIVDGKLNATIVVGSPDPHGPEKARSRDGYYAVDLALFLGSFLTMMPDMNVKLDTEVRSEDLEKNLILIGGPVINTVTGKVNSRMPVRFDQKNNWSIVSEVSGRMYQSDETGVIVKMKSPFNRKKQLLVVAGKRYAGTKAVMIAMIKHLNEVIKGNSSDRKVLARVVEGIDLDSDGIVDEVDFLE